MADNITAMAYVTKKKAKKKAKNNELGNCYEMAIQTAESLIREGHTNVMVVHGQPTGTGGDVVGIKYGHAWVELNLNGFELVFDYSNDNEVVIERAIYYMAGQIADCHRYTFKEAQNFMLLTGHYGPW